MPPSALQEHRMYVEQILAETQLKKKFKKYQMNFPSLYT